MDWKESYTAPMVVVDLIAIKRQGDVHFARGPSLPSAPPALSRWLSSACRSPKLERKELKASIVKSLKGSSNVGV